MSKSRRKTLSHNEIENFLSEISVNAVDAKRQSLLPTELLAFQSSPQNSTESVSTVPDPVFIDDFDLMRKFCKVRCIYTFYRCNTLDVWAYNIEQITCQRSQDIYSSSDGLELRKLAFQILECSKYKVLSDRVISEEAQHPLGSVEAKRAVLISLTPMLTDAENARKRETQECEDFTRCKSTKTKSRSSSYEYVDIDSGLIVSYADFETRYLHC
jgi:hypothetical protein